MRLIRDTFKREERQLLSLHFVSYLTQRGFPVLATFLVAHVLGITEFGFFIAAFTAYNVLTLFADLGLSLTTTTRVGKLASLGQADAISTAIVTSTIATAFLGLAISGLLLANLQTLQNAFFGSHARWDFLAPGAIYVPVMAVALVLGGAIAGLRNYRALAAIGVTSGVLYLTMTLGLAIGFGAQGALWGTALGATGRAALCMWSVRDQLFPAGSRWKMQDIRREGVELVSIALPASIAGFAFTPVNAYLLGSMFQHPNGAAEVGAFGITQQIFSLTMLVPGILTQFFLPRMAALTEAPRAIRKTLVWQYTAIATLAAFLFASPILFFPSLALGLFGAEYSSHSDVLSTMMLASLVSAPQGVFSNYMLARGMNWVRVATWFVWAAVVVGAVVTASEFTALSSSLAFLYGWCALTFLQGLVVFFDQ